MLLKVGLEGTCEVFFLAIGSNCRETAAVSTIEAFRLAKKGLTLGVLVMVQNDDLRHFGSSSCTGASISFVPSLKLGSRKVYLLKKQMRQAVL